MPPLVQPVQDLPADANQTAFAACVVVGLTTTAVVPGPSEIVEVAALYLDQPALTRPPLVFCCQPSGPLIGLPANTLAHLSFAPPWTEVAGHVAAVLAGRTVITHDPDRLAMLHAHLPGWAHEAVLHTRDLAADLWPGLPDYTLHALSSMAGTGTVVPGATGEAEAVALLLLALTGHTTSNGPPHSLNGGTRDGWASTGGPQRTRRLD